MSMMNAFKNTFDFKNIKAIVFDMDGVLLDTETICDKCWKIASSEFNLANIEEASALCRGQSRPDAKKTLIDIYGPFDVDAFEKRSNELFLWIEENEGINTLHYAKEALEYLSKKYRLALASSTKLENIKKNLNQCGLLNYFETITAGDQVIHSKPEPEIYQKAALSLKLKEFECLAVEDSPNGITSAFHAGMPVVMIPDKVQPDSELEKMCSGIFSSLETFCKTL